MDAPDRAAKPATMSKNYNFKFNPDLPSKSDIDKHRDFDALLGQYHAAQRAQQTAKVRKLVIRSLSAAAAVALLAIGVRAVFFSGETAPPISNTAFLAEQPFIDQQNWLSRPQPSLMITDSSLGERWTCSTARCMTMWTFSLRASPCATILPAMLISWNLPA